jgi:uncharacterized protein YndB with AHSA1/START domain
MIDILHRVGIKAPMSDVYAALATIEGLSGWWTENTTGTSAPGGTIAFTFNLADGTLLGVIEMKVIALETDREVLWRCTGGADEWLGTDVVFKLSREGDYTIVRFGHKHWREAVEFTEHCSTKWATFLMSLKALLETGQGRPAPNDVLISDWH